MVSTQMSQPSEGRLSRLRSPSVLALMVVGLVGYAVYRRRFVTAPVRETVKAPPAFGAALALEYRRIVVPIVPRTSAVRFGLIASLAPRMIHAAPNSHVSTVAGTRSGCSNGPGSGNTTAERTASSDTP